MLKSFHAIHAKNKSIIDLVQKGVFDKREGDLMRTIAGNSENRRYGIAALKLGAARCKYSAAAAVFARLAVYYAKSPSNGLTDREWKRACQNALILSGASPDEAKAVMQGLLEMNARVEQEPVV